MPRFNCLRVFLTYSQCGALTPNDLIAHFPTLVPIPDWAEIASELHEDGSPHLHAVVVFSTRFQGNMSSFDVGGKHPNAQPIRHGHANLFRCRHYLRKGNRGKEEQHEISNHKLVACNYDAVPETFGTPTLYFEKAKCLDWGGILAESEDKDTFLQLAKQNQPADYVLRYDSILRYAAAAFDREVLYEPPFAPDSFRVLPEMDEWVQQFFQASIPGHPVIDIGDY